MKVFAITLPPLKDTFDLILAVLMTLLGIWVIQRILTWFDGRHPAGCDCPAHREEEG